jgi:glutamate-1-semialdehyde 2,1-aminomutase
MPSLAERYATEFPKSRACYERARQLFPTGVTHDTRMMEPFPIYVERCLGSHKWDVDGHDLIDYFVGHGSHILGHSAPEVVEAVREQMGKGTHPGACHELEIRWAELVRELVPCAERVRFTGSGTEATMMALRLARLATGKPKFLRFRGHFHGWHDAVTVSSDPPYDAPGVPGVTDGTAGGVVAVPPNDLNLVEDALTANADIAAVILEPTGGHWGAVPIRGEFLQGLREICTRKGVLLIFDEVITGFRVAPGGAQAVYGVTPDLATFAKILAGGLPGGCVAGRADLLAFIEPRPGKPKMKHPGTYNGNPLSAAAGVATLTRIKAGGVCEAASEAARMLRNQFNARFTAAGAAWIAYGDFSMVRVLPGYNGPRPMPEMDDNSAPVPYDGDLDRLDGPKNMKQVHALRQAMLLQGVDWWGTAAMTSAAHTTADVSVTSGAMQTAVEWLTAEGLG